MMIFHVSPAGRRCVSCRALGRSSLLTDRPPSLRRPIAPKRLPRPPDASENPVESETLCGIPAHLVDMEQVLIAHRENEP